MSDLADFLLARITEDEAVARVAQLIVRSTPRRLLAECEAKRRIVALHGNDPNETLSFDPVVHLCISCDEAFPCQHARLLALPYADHPDYRPEWRP